MTENIYVLIHNEDQYDKFIEEIRKNYNRNCKDDQYGYKDKNYSNNFPSMFKVNTEYPSVVEHQPLMDSPIGKYQPLMDIPIGKYQEWTDNLISVDDFIKINKNKYIVRVEFTRTIVELGEIEVFAKNKHHARMIAFGRSGEIKEQDMWESESTEITVNGEYWDWNAEQIEKGE